MEFDGLGTYREMGGSKEMRLLSPALSSAYAKEGAAHGASRHSASESNRVAKANTNYSKSDFVKS